MFDGSPSSSHWSVTLPTELFLLATIYINVINLILGPIASTLTNRPPRTTARLALIHSRLAVCENSVLRSALGPEREEVRGEKRKVHN
jgi:hypothetical protein